MEIDIWHDTVCPWCRIGKANLFTALDGWGGPAVTMRYHAFLLNENIPEGGVPFAAYMQRSKGLQDLEMLFEGPRRAGEAAGLTFNFDKLNVAPNTILSHRLIALTPDDKRLAVIDAIYAAYFEHGQDVGQLDVLLDIAEAQGLDRDALRTQLEGDAALDVVMEDLYTARRIGIRGVPAVVLGGRLLVSGAQPPEVWRRALDQAVSMPQ